MADLRRAAGVLKEILGLKYEPIAVKFFEDRVQLDGFETPSERRYCQVLMGAREGKRYLLTADNIACPAAAWALGFKEPPPTLSSGEMPFKMGIFGSPEAVRSTLNSMSRLPYGQVQDGRLLPRWEKPLSSLM